MTDDALFNVHETAFGLARKHNLVCTDGTIVCWECKQVEALLPSLHCPACLQTAWARLHIHDPLCEQREQTDDDKRRMAPNKE